MQSLEGCRHIVWWGESEETAVMVAEVENPDGETRGGVEGDIDHDDYPGVDWSVRFGVPDQGVGQPHDRRGGLHGE